MRSLETVGILEFCCSLLKDKLSFADTTRKPRPGEEHGKDYYFVTKEEMQEAISNGEFLENAEFGGNFYGTRFT